MFETMPLTHKIHMLGHLMEQEANSVLSQEMNISFNSYIILYILNKHGEVSQHFMADKMKISNAAISKRIKLLAKDEFTSTKVNENNRREHIVMISEKGKEILETATTLLTQNFENKIKKYSKRDEFEKLLNELLMIMCEDKNDNETC